VVSTTVCPVSGFKTVSAPAQTAVPITTNVLEIQSTHQATGAVASSSIQSGEEMHNSQISAASENSQTAAESLTQTLSIISTLTVVSRFSVTASSATSALTGMTAESAPSVDASSMMSSASQAYPGEQKSSTKLVSDMGVEETPSSSSGLYQAQSSSGQGFSSETSSTRVTQPSDTATGTQSSMMLATGSSHVDSTSLSLGASHASSTASSYKPVLYTGVASSVQWNPSLVLGSAIAFAMAMSL